MHMQLLATVWATICRYVCIAHKNNKINNSDAVLCMFPLASLATYDCEVLWVFCMMCHWSTVICMSAMYISPLNVHKDAPAYESV